MNKKQPKPIIKPLKNIKNFQGNVIGINSRRGWKNRD